MGRIYTYMTYSGRTKEDVKNAKKKGDKLGHWLLEPFLSKT